MCDFLPHPVVSRPWPLPFFIPFLYGRSLVAYLERETGSGPETHSSGLYTFGPWKRTDYNAPLWWKRRSIITCDGPNSAAQITHARF